MCLRPTLYRSASRCGIIGSVTAMQPLDDQFVVVAKSFQLVHWAVIFFNSVLGELAVVYKIMRYSHWTVYQLANSGYIMLRAIVCTHLQTKAWTSRSLIWRLIHLYSNEMTGSWSGKNTRTCDHGSRKPR